MPGSAPGSHCPDRRNHISATGQNRHARSSPSSYFTNFSVFCPRFIFRGICACSYCSRLSLFRSALSKAAVGFHMPLFKERKIFINIQCLPEHGQKHGRSRPLSKMQIRTERSLKSQVFQQHTAARLCGTVGRDHVGSALRRDPVSQTGRRRGDKTIDQRRPPTLLSIPTGSQSRSASDRPFTLRASLITSTFRRYPSSERPAPYPAVSEGSQ